MENKLLLFLFLFELSLCLCAKTGTKHTYAGRMRQLRCQQRCSAMTNSFILPRFADAARTKAPSKDTAKFFLLYTKLDRTRTCTTHTHAHTQHKRVYGLLIEKFLLFYALSAHPTVFIFSKCFNYLNFNCSCSGPVNSFARISSHFCFCVGDADVSAGAARV